MPPQPQTAPAPAHPEVAPGVWTWTAASQPPQSMAKPAAKPPKAGAGVAIAYVLLIAFGVGTVGLTIYRAGVSAGESGSASKVATLESQAASQNQQIEAFCKAAGH